LKEGAVRLRSWGKSARWTLTGWANQNLKVRFQESCPGQAPFLARLSTVSCAVWGKVPNGHQPSLGMLEADRSHQGVIQIVKPVNNVKMRRTSTLEILRFGWHIPLAKYCRDLHKTKIIVSIQLLFIEEERCHPRTLRLYDIVPATG